MLQSISQSISTTCPHSFFFFQSVKLNESSTEAAHCSKDVNAEELLGEENAEFSELHSEDNFDSCEICKKPFSRRNILFEHTSASSRETSYCEKCSKSLSVNSNAMRRYRGRERSLSCNVCSKSFTSRYHLDNHIRVHNRERFFSCKMCNKMFAQKSAMWRHLRVHSGERPKSVRNGLLGALT
jgi:transposase